MSTSPSLPSDSSREVPSWKQEVNEKLAAHRTRHAPKAEEQISFPHELDANESRTAQVAARVAARYANAPSYSELLAKEAHAAARVAEAAVLEARAAAQAVLENEERKARAIIAASNASSAAKRTPSTASAEPTAARRASAEESATPSAVSPSSVSPSSVLHSPALPTPVYTASASTATKSGRKLAEESLQHSSQGGYGDDLFAEAVVEPIESIAGNLIQFPREIVATRRARPRLAEGPLREEGDAGEAPQLRIFEVDANTISQTPGVDHPMPEWSSIRLDARVAQPGKEHAHLTNYLDVPMNTASIGDRMMAALVDLSLAGIAFLVFILVFVACTPHPPTGKGALVAAGGTLIFFMLLYQYLFFMYSESTPGMRYARIALCTFEDENPTRQRMRNRIGALVLSACTLGMGFAWAFFDDDTLGWHDRLSRTYQRSYR